MRRKGDNNTVTGDTMKPVWIGISCNINKEEVKLLNVIITNRTNALKEARSRVNDDSEVTVIDFTQSAEQTAKEVTTFLIDCGIPEKNIPNIIRNIGKEMFKKIIA